MATSNPPMSVWPAASRMTPPTSPTPKNRYRIVPHRGPVHLIASVLIGLLTPSIVPRIAVTNNNARNVKES